MECENRSRSTTCVCNRRMDWPIKSKWKASATELIRAFECLVCVFPTACAHCTRFHFGWGRGEVSANSLSLFQPVHDCWLAQLLLAICVYRLKIQINISLLFIDLGFTNSLASCLVQQAPEPDQIAFIRVVSFDFSAWGAILLLLCAYVPQCQYGS